MMSVKSRVNQPERVLVNSNDDTTQPSGAGFFLFNCNLPTPILDAKRSQIIRISIPNVALQIPDYQLMFFYYKLATATTVPTDANLYCVRLYPSTWKAPAAYTTFVQNGYYNDPNDLIADLNTAAAAGGDLLANNPYWDADDISFAYDTNTKKIDIMGSDAGSFYTNAGWDDPLVLAAMAGTGAKGQIVLPNAFGGGTTRQPSLPQYTLNQRIGFALSGTCRSPNSFGNGINQYATDGNATYAGLVSIYAESYPNLVYSNDIYLYTNFANGSTLSSSNRHNLLCVVPVNAPPLGVISYVAATNNLLTKLSSTINNISIEMRDDADQPFVLPDSAVVNVELSFSYQDKVY